MKLQKLNARGFEHVFVMVFIVLVTSVVGTYLLVTSYAASKSIGVDVSSPQCGRIGSLPRYKWGMVGLNGTRLDFAVNPCVSRETRHFDQYALYVGANYPSAHCSSKITPLQCGGKAGNFDIALAQKLNLNPTKWWIDVESGPGIPWSTPAQNSQFIRGLFFTLSTTGKPIGIYSTQEMWQQITGGLQLPSSSNWVASGIKGLPTAAQINAYCSKGFGGAPTSVVQYINNNNIDVNIPC
jgi:hypothetical protein